jgi:hypothetical protein
LCGITPASERSSEPERTVFLAILATPRLASRTSSIRPDQIRNTCRVVE